MTAKASTAAATTEREPAGPRPKATVQPPRPARIAEFQSAAAAIEERPVPPVARAILYVVVALIASAIAWASIAQIDRIVVATGRLVTSKPMIVIQPLETGVIRSLEVSIGSEVKAGDLLATLDATFAAADTVSLNERLEGLEAEAARLRGEIDGTPPTMPPGNRYAPSQTRLYAQRQAEYTARLGALETAIARAEANIVANRETQASLKERLRVLNQIVGMREELLRRNVGSQLQLMEAQLNQMSLREQLTSRVSEEKDLALSLEHARHERSSFVEEWSRTAAERLVTVTRDIDSTRQELSKAERRNTLVNLRAPADGVVLEIAQRSVGSVAREAEPLITIVPMHVPLEVEAEIRAADISRVRIGDHVRHKLEALPFQRHGHLEGSVRIVTEDAFRPQNEQREPIYRARISVESMELRDVPKDFRLIPGMTLTSEIVVGRRSVISYFVYPILRVFNESLREP